MTELAECGSRDVWEFVRMCVSLRNTSGSDEEPFQVAALNWLDSVDPGERHRLDVFVDEMAACWLYQEYERQLKINPISMDAMLAALRKMESLERDARAERDQLRAACVWDFEGRGEWGTSMDEAIKHVEGLGYTCLTEYLKRIRLALETAK